MFKVGDKVVIAPNVPDDIRIDIQKALPEINLQGYAVITEVDEEFAYFAWPVNHGLGWFLYRFIHADPVKVRKINYRKWAKENKVYRYSRLPLGVLKEAYPHPGKLKKFVKEKWFLNPLGFLDNWALRQLDGTVVRYLNQACLWDIKKIPECTQFVYGVSLGKHARYREWLSYHLNESPFAHVFKTKDPKQAIVDGLELDVNANASHCVAAMTNVRQGWEHNDIIDMFFHLIELGAKKNTAFVFAHYLTKRRSGYEVYVRSAHTSFCPGMSVKSLANFANRSLLLLQEKPPLKKGNCNYLVNKSIAEVGNIRGDNLENAFPGVKGAGWDGVKTLTKEQLIGFIKTFESM